MRNQLLTTLAIALAGVYGVAAFPEEAPQTALPGSIEPDRITYKNSVSPSHTIYFRLPGVAVGNAEDDRPACQITVTDENGKEIDAMTYMSYSQDSSGSELGIDVEDTDAPGGWVELRGSIRMNTGDGIQASETVTLTRGQGGTVEIGGVVYKIEPWSDPLFPSKRKEGWLKMVPQGEAPLLLEISGHGHPCYARLRKNDGEPPFFVIEFNDKFLQAGVRSLVLTNPHPVDVPVDYHVSLDTGIQTEFDIPADSGIRLDEVQDEENSLFPGGVICTRKYAFVLDGTEASLGFIPDQLGVVRPEGMVGGLEGGDTRVVCGAPKGRPATPVAEIPVHIAYPVEPEGRLDCHGEIKVDVASFSAEPWPFELEADGKPHRLDIPGLPFSYTATARTKEEFGDWHVSCTYPQPDDMLVDFRGALASCDSIETIGTDPESGRPLIRRELLLFRRPYQSGDNPVLLVRPYTDRRTITIPVSISGKPRQLVKRQFVEVGSWKFEVGSVKLGAPTAHGIRHFLLPTFNFLLPDKSQFAVSRICVTGH